VDVRGRSGNTRDLRAALCGALAAVSGGMIG